MVPNFVRIFTQKNLPAKLHPTSPPLSTMFSPRFMELSQKIQHREILPAINYIEIGVRPINFFVQQLPGGGFITIVKCRLQRLNLQRRSS